MYLPKIIIVLLRYLNVAYDDIAKFIFRLITNMIPVKMHKQFRNEEIKVHIQERNEQLILRQGQMLKETNLEMLKCIDAAGESQKYMIGL